MLIERLKLIFESKKVLESFINNELLDLADYLNECDNQNLLDNSDLLYELLASSESKLLSININSRSVKLLLLLIEISQRLGHRSNFLFLYNHIKQSGYLFGSRIEAAFMFYEFGLDSDELLERLTLIHDLLQASYTEEGDTEYLVLNCFINYYSFLVVYFSEFNPAVIKKFWRKVNFIKINNKESFLNFSIIEGIESVSIESIEHALKEYNILLRAIKNVNLSNGSKKNFNLLIEDDTHYVKLIKKDPKISFNVFLSVSKKLFSVEDSTKVWGLLNRGLSVLDEEIQLLGYMHSFGEMHRAKIDSALEFINIPTLTADIEVYDWGSGQGIASICLCDFLKEHEKIDSIKSICLIEPSELSIKRAAFNISNYLSVNKIRTLNKTINEVNKDDFNSDRNATKIHLFSNILDVEAFSIKFLIELLNSIFCGFNILICTSPKLPSPKDYRFLFFVEDFKKNNSFKLLGSISEGKYEWREDKKWTREICVFEVNL